MIDNNALQILVNYPRVNKPPGFIQDAKVVFIYLEEYVNIAQCLYCKN